MAGLEDSTKRAFLKVLPAMAMVTATNVQPHPDSDLLALEMEFNKAVAQYNSVEAFAKEEPSDEAYALSDHLYEVCGEIVGKIEGQHAKTMDGLRVQARAIDWCCCGEEITFGAGETTDVRLAARIVKSLLGLTA
ncbi:MAG: hypothetical protein DI629_12085 [Mesorhizobium amorphae]|nr:MAG: hypothetical protein DI629_12085 [Mesorhizobium amorphae]